MKVEIKELPHSKIKGEVFLDKDDLSFFFEEAKKILAREKELNPQKEVSSQAIDQQILSLAVSESYFKIVREKEIEAISQPVVRVLSFLPQKELSFSFEVSVLPKVNLPDDYQVLAREIFSQKEEIKVEEKEIEESLSWLRESRAKIEEKDKKIERGDTVDLLWQVVDDEGRIIEEEEKRITLKEKGEVSSFEENLLGLRLGQEKEFASEKGPQKVKIKIKKVYQRTLPEINEEFAQRLGNFRGLSDLKESIAQGIRMEKEKERKERQEREFLKKVSQKMRIEIPEILWQKEKEKILNGLNIFLEKMNISLENYLKMIKKDKDSFDKEVEKQAKTLILNSLILSQIAREEGIFADEKEIEDYAQKVVSQYHLQEEEARKKWPEIYLYAKEIITFQKVFDFLRSLAKV